MKTEQKLSGNMKPVETEDGINNAADSAEDTENKKKKVKDKRDSTISFRVSKAQREKITSTAKECGMNLSDYVLSRAYGYEPKVRLTPEQEAVREQLVIARSDYAKYTSMLNAMSQDERRAMFRNQPWMIGALRLLGKTADRITRLIKKTFRPEPHTGGENHDSTTRHSSRNRQGGGTGMIGKAKSINHGINDIRYISGESRNKEHPELIYHVKDNLLPCGLDAQGVWDMMKTHAPMKNNVIRIEISPAKEHTKDFTMQDWQQLWDDFIREFDKIEMADDDGKVYSHKTNLADSIYTVWLHLESDSRITHLHAAVCRKDRNGRTNNDHKIHIRAHDAAQAVAVKRGWITAMEIHKANADKVAEDLMDILRAMPSWSWGDYVVRVRANGYTLVERPDNKGGIKGYVVGKGKAKFKASELGKGRKLMASRIEQTWQKLHGQSETKSVQPAGKTVANTVTPVVPVAAKPVAQPMAHSDKPVADYSAWRENTSRYELTQDGKTSLFYIPDDVMQVFNDEFDYRETSNWEELTDMAVALFVGLTALDSVSTGGGGSGSSNDNDWRDKKDEDEIERARRCARAAAAHIGKKTKSERKR